MSLGFRRAATYNGSNTVDGDISGHTSVFTFPRVCYVFCYVSRVHRNGQLTKDDDMPVHVDTTGLVCMCMAIGS